VTRVCLIGEAGSDLRYELLSRETAREALSTYDLERPFENALAVRTVSVGAAVSLLNDLNWYLTRFVDEALVLEPSVSGDEWLSRSLAERLRDGDVEPEATGEFCKIYGLERIDAGAEPDSEDAPAAAASGPDSAAGPSDPTDRADGDAAGGGTDRADGSGPTRRLVEPLYVRRTDGDLPDYDLRDVEGTLVVRLTEAEYGP
jgi:hypothetical protein